MKKLSYEELKKFYKNLDRALFLDAGYNGLAQHDGPLPIGFDQTISQPSLVLEMTRLLAPSKDSKVLEIGTGSGYQTALLAEFSAAVYSIERFAALSKKAQTRLAALGYENVFFKIDDGSQGWPEESPFDRIMVTAAAGQRPEVLIDQLAHGGKMLVPFGPPTVQELLLISKDRDGKISEESHGFVRFVEMVGRYGWD